VWCKTDNVDSYDITVYSRLIDDPAPSDFGDFVKRFAGEAAVAFKIPDDLSKALLRAEAMVPENTPVELEVTTVEDGDEDVRVLRLYSNTATGEFDDMVEIADTAGHRDLTVKADVKLIRRGLAGRTSLAITRGSVVLTGPKDFFHFISTRR
jgi:hypothetical protein